MAIGRLSRPCVRERGRGTVTTMNLLTRWFRRSPAAPSWIEAAALVKRREQDATLLILDVRGPDEFTGPLGHIAGATNLPVNDLPERLPELVRKDRPWWWSERPTADHRSRQISCGRPAWRTSPC
jgi:hypothetical protein